MDDDVVVRTSFGTIRRWRAEDAPALSRHGDDRRIWRNMSDGFPSPFTPGRAEAFIAMTHRQSPTTYFAIAGEAEAIGGIGLGLGTDVHRHTAELGYWLAAPLWGRGYMREAIACFTRAAFTLVRGVADLRPAVRAQRRVDPRARASGLRARGAAAPGGAQGGGAPRPMRVCAAGRRSGAVSAGARGVDRIFLTRGVTWQGRATSGKSEDDDDEPASP